MFVIDFFYAFGGIWLFVKHLYSLWSLFVLQHFGESPLPAYEPAFDWENERSLIFGQRTPETLPTHSRFTLLQNL